MSRLKFKGPDTRLPITYDLLQKIVSILSGLCTSQYEVVLFSAAFSLAFFGFLRISEVTSGKRNDIFSRHTIQVENVKVTQSNIEIFMTSSKTDQLGLGTKVLICKQSHSSVCPVGLLNKYIQVRPPIHGPLFCHFDGSPLSRYQFSAMLKKTLVFLGITGNYGTHSFRIGSATFSSMQGFSEEKIQIMGRWKSCAVKGYIRKT